MRSFRRLAQGGRIERTKPLSARLDGKPTVIRTTVKSELIARTRTQP